MSIKTELLQQRIVTAGGGTGHFELLSGLKGIINPGLITAIPGVTDNGGHSGQLRSTLGVLPPGDLRRCLVALAPDTKQRALADFLSFRFPTNDRTENTLAGHSLGNLVIAGHEMMYGSQQAAVDVLRTLFDISSDVVPASLSNVNLLAMLSNGQRIDGETKIDTRGEQDDYDPNIGIDYIFLEGQAYLNPRASEAILQADWFIIAPGDLYTSILPIFLINGFVNALMLSKAKVIYCGNLMTKRGETDNFKASDCLQEVLKYLAGKPIDYAILNQRGYWPKEANRVRQSYNNEGKKLMETDIRGCQRLLPNGGCIKVPLAKYIPTERIIRHNPERLAQAIKRIIENHPASGVS